MSRTDTYNEQFLLVRVSAGDEQAFTELFNYWQPILASYVYRISKSRELTAELVQDVFLSVWVYREKLRRVESFKAYLFTICRNKSLTALRRQLRELNIINEWNKLHHDTSALQSTDNPLHEKLEFMDEAIAGLTSRQREVYRLHRHERLTYQQIADKLGIGKESVKTHLEHAVRHIRKYLENRIALLLVIIGVLFDKV